jgi:DNA polymerase III epsilon subunit-like protein
VGTRAQAANGHRGTVRYSGLVYPGVPIPAEAQAVQGISDADVHDHGTEPRPLLEMIDRNIADAARVHDDMPGRGGV